MRFFFFLKQNEINSELGKINKGDIMVRSHSCTHQITHNLVLEIVIKVIYNSNGCPFVTSNKIWISSSKEPFIIQLFAVPSSLALRDKQGSEYTYSLNNTIFIF